MSMWRRMRGFTVIESLFYAAVGGLLFAVVVATLINFMGMYRSLSASLTIQQAALGSFDRIAYHARSAYDIDPSSVLNSHPGTLVFLEQDGLNTIEWRLYLEGSRIAVSKDGVVEGFLTPSDAEVTSLIFRKIDGVERDAVRSEITFEVPYRNVGTTTAKTASFYNTFVLRGSY